MVDDVQKGQVRYRNRHAQLHDGSGLNLPRGITHTDADAIYDFMDESLIVFCEFKMRGMELPFGQKAAIHNIARLASNLEPNVCVVLVLDHDVEDSEEPVIMRDCTVRTCDVYFKGRPYDEFTVAGQTLKDALHNMLELRRKALKRPFLKF